MNRLLLLSGAAVLLLAGPAMAAADYNPAASAQAAQGWRQQDAAIEAQDANLTTPSGEKVDVIANNPIPDTSANRDRFGQPDSMSGRLTRPIGD